MLRSSRRRINLDPDRTATLHGIRGGDGRGLPHQPIAHRELAIGRFGWTDHGPGGPWSRKGSNRVRQGAEVSTLRGSRRPHNGRRTTELAAGASIFCGPDIARGQTNAEEYRDPPDRNISSGWLCPANGAP